MKVKWLILAGVGLMLLGAGWLWVEKRPAYLSLSYLKKNLGEVEVDEREQLSYRFWQTREETEGFLWGISNKYLYLLNLGGLKRYGWSDKSFMYYYDICGGEAKSEVEAELFFGQNRFGKRAKVGDYVNLTLYQEEDGGFYINKVWGYSGDYYLNGLAPMEKQCEN
jgi:hypothetical protein